MPLRVAFDIDGVLADMDTALARQAAHLFPAAGRGADAAAQEPGGPLIESQAAAVPAGLSLSSEQQTRLWQHVSSLENFWETLAPFEPEAILRLSDLAAELRWEVIFLTRRPETHGLRAQVQTQKWLEAQGFLRPSVFVVQRPRGLIATALDLDVVVDDRLENCMDIAVHSPARAILVLRDNAPVPAAARRLRISVARSVDECLHLLVKADAAGAQPGRLKRVMRRLGIGRPAD